MALVLVGALCGWQAEVVIQTATTSVGPKFQHNSTASLLQKPVGEMIEALRPFLLQSVQIGAL